MDWIYCGRRPRDSEKESRTDRPKKKESDNQRRMQESKGKPQHTLAKTMETKALYKCTTPSRQKTTIYSRPLLT